MIDGVWRDMLWPRLECVLAFISVVVFEDTHFSPCFIDSDTDICISNKLFYPADHLNCTAHTAAVSNGTIKYIKDKRAHIF